MEQLKAKLKEQGGFTMVELLIVVAIIAILVAVSIPMMSSALEKSREAVDQANYRDAIALASVKYVTDAKNAVGKTWYYCVDAKHQGYLTDNKSTGTASTDDSVVKATCKCTVEGKELSLTIADPPANKETPDIKLSWMIDGDGKTIEGDLSSGSGGGGGS